MESHEGNWVNGIYVFDCPFYDAYNLQVVSIVNSESMVSFVDNLSFIGINCGGGKYRCGVLQTFLVEKYRAINQEEKLGFSDHGG